MSNDLLAETQAKLDTLSLKSSKQQRNLVAQNQKYRLHLTSLSHILRRAPLDKSFTKTDHNKFSIKFPSLMDEQKLLWSQFKAGLCHKWMGNKVHLTEYFYDLTIAKDGLQIPLRWKEEELYTPKRMSLIFNSCDKITAKDLKQILYQMTRNLANLEEFTLNFDNNRNITDKDLPFIGRLIARHLPNLKHLHLGFYNCKEITGERIHMLLPPISRNLSQLERLFLNFGGCGKIRDEDLILFGSKLRGSLTNLKRFIMYLWAGQNFTDRGLMGLGTAICQNLVNLKKLTLNFRGCGEISSEGLDLLGVEINKYLLNLRKLTLILDGCAHIKSENCQKFKNKMIDTENNMREVLFSDDPADNEYFSPFKTRDSDEKDYD